MILRILIPLVVLLMLPAWGIDRLWWHRHVKGWKRWLVYTPSATLSLLLILTAANESYSMAADHWKGQLLSVTLTFLVPQALLALLLGLGQLAKRRAPRISHAINIAAVITSLLSLAAMTYGMTGGYRHLVVKHYTYTDRRISPAFNGYRIVQLSDLHVGTLHGQPQVVRNIVDSVNAQRPDLIVFTGDLVNYHAEEIYEFEPILRQLKAKDGVISIMGNHDYAQYFRWESPLDSLADIRRLQNRQRAMNWHLLLNDNHIIRRGNDSIAIIGVENDGRPPFPALADLPRAQRNLKDNCFKILLSHDPSHWHRQVVPNTTIPLTLSGHTHGMQFKIGNFSPASWFYKEWGGEYTDKNGHTLYVSLGTGEVLLPFRLGAWPEINVIQLNNGEK